VKLGKSSSAVLERASNNPIIHRITRFGVVSLIGLGLDFSLFTVLSLLDITPFISNLASASVGVTFVYFVSAKRIFYLDNQFIWRIFLLYISYQLLAIPSASWGIDALTMHSFLPALAAKIAITPVTFSVNFIFMTIASSTRFR
jgi:putative flippase GtrA